MARKSKLSAQEIAEIDETNRIQTRKTGFGLMSARDRGWDRVKSMSGHSSHVLWHSNRPLQDYEARRDVPEGMFLLDVVIEGKTHTLAYDVDEFRKAIRWA